MTPPLLEANGIVKQFTAAGPPAVADVNLRVMSGMSLGVVGESGSGKSTLSRILAGSLRPDAGHVRVLGRDWVDVHRENPLRRTVQMIFQDPYGALPPWLTAGSIVAEAIRNWETVTRRQAMDQARHLLEQVGLGHLEWRRYPRELSGGQCQRIGIARALACKPSVLIADEPTSALDVSVQAQILNLLVSLKESQDLALVLVSHDLSVVHFVTQEAIVMYRGRVVERGRTEDLFLGARHPYTRLLIASSKAEAVCASSVQNDVPDRHPCVFAMRCPELQSDCQELSPDAPTKEGEWRTECVRPFVSGSSTSAGVTG
jgi:oligopeptide/dipeptide ABC transporter ATP-binding protein